MIRRDQLKDYQQDAISKLYAMPHAAVWMDMRMGKTSVALTTWADLKEVGLIGRALIIAPPRVAQTVWPNEPNEWEHLNHLKIVSLSGETPARRLEILTGGDWDAISVGYHNLDWLAKNSKHIPGDVQLAIADELHRLSNGTGTWSRAFKHLRKKMLRVIGLTGSPSTNGYTKLYGQMHAIDGGKRLGDTKTKFTAEYLKPHPHIKYVHLFRDEMKPILRERIADVVLNYKAADYIKVSEIVEEDFFVELPPKARKMYDDMQEKYFSNTGEGIVTAANSGVARMKLAQVASGFLYPSPDDDDFDFGETVTLHTAKINQLKLLIEQADCPVLVAVQFKEDMEMITKSIKEAVKLKDVPAKKLKQEWDAGALPVLVTHPESAMEGLTLHAGGNVVIWFSPTINLLQYEQFNARLQKINPDKPVRVLRILAKNTVDEHIVSAVDRKDREQTDLRNAVVKLIIQNLRGEI